jgi:hypothetical protein
VYQGFQEKKMLMAEEFYWRSKICIYECKWKSRCNYSVLKSYFLKNTFVFTILIFNVIMILIFYEYFLKC